MANNSFKTIAVAAAGSVLMHWAVLQGPIPWLDEPDDAPPGDLSMVTLPAATVAPTPTADPTANPTVGLRPRPADTLAQTTPGQSTPSQATSSEEPRNPAAEPAQEPAKEAEKAVAKPVEPIAVRLKFRVSLGSGDNDALAMVTHSLALSEGHYEISSRGEALGLLATLYSGLLTQKSVGNWSSGGFETLHYTEQRGKKPETHVNLSPGDRNAQFSNGNGVTLASKDAQDRLSVIYHLGQSLRNKPPTAGENRRFEVLSTNGVETYRFTMVGSESLSVDGVSREAWHVSRQASEPGEKTGIDIWYDLDGDGWPLQIQLTDKKGMVITQKRVMTQGQTPH